MNRENLIKKLQQRKSEDISLNDVFNIFLDNSQASKRDLFLDRLKVAIENIFEIDDISSKCRKINYIVARSTFVHLAIKEDCRQAEIRNKIGLDRVTILHSKNKFYEYQKWYHEFAKPISQALEYYNNLKQ